MLELLFLGCFGWKLGFNCNCLYKWWVVLKDIEEYLIKCVKNNIVIRKCCEKVKKKKEEMDDKMR